MAATGHPLATVAALEVLGQGGNAVDAALAAAAVTWVTLPMMCGPGGDAFALVHDPRQGGVVAIGAGGMAPAAATPDWFRDRGHRLIPLAGPLAAAVPGGVGVMAELATRFGTKSMAELYQHARRHAVDGFPLDSPTAELFAAHTDRLAGDAESRRIFGRARAGSVLQQADLGATIDRLAAEGAGALYGGVIGEQIAAYMRAAGGLMTLADLAANRVDVQPALAIGYRGLEVFQTPPPSQGFVVLEELKILEGFDLRSMPPEGDEAIHLLVEAKKLATADRNRYAGDPAMTGFDPLRLLTDEYAAARRAEFDLNRASRLQAVPAAEGDTTYLCVVDRDGMAVSFIHSLSLAFGAAVTVPGTGILLNDRAGRGFTLAEGHPNQLAPGKRTMSTLNCYLAMFGGAPVVVGGTPGGDGQVQWNLQVLVSLLDRGLDPQAAVSAPRWTHNPTTDPWNLDNAETFTIEDRVPAATIAGLRRRGHPVTTIGPFAARGAAQVITVDHASGVFRGASDPRAPGLALGR